MSIPVIMGFMLGPGDTAGAGRIIEAACWAHGRRKFFELAELQKAPVAIEAVRRIDELFAIEREINGKPPDERLRVRQNAKSFRPKRRSQKPSTTA